MSATTEQGEVKNAYRVCHRLEVRLRAELSLRDEVGDGGEVSHGLGDIVLLGDSVRDLWRKRSHVSQGTGKEIGELERTSCSDVWVTVFVLKLVIVDRYVFVTSCSEVWVTWHEQANVSDDRTGRGEECMPS
jgi:hypothetical protein